MDINSATSSLRIALLVGSVRDDRLAGTLAAWVQSEASRIPWVDLDVVDLVEHDLPMTAMNPGGGSSSISGRLHEADGFLIVTPEYNHSFPAPLKNAID